MASAIQSLILAFMKKNDITLFLWGGLVILLVVFAIVTRLYKLDQYPPQLNRDEAALAINALYIRESGVDEWGMRLPIQFKSFGDYKLPGYIYILSLLFHFQISDLIVRLPSALAGISLLLLSTYWATSILKIHNNKYLILFFGASMATAPFAIFYSRMAWEANLGLTFMMAGLLLLHHNKPTYQKDLCALFLFGFAVVTYNTPFLLLPFFILSVPMLRGVKNIKSWLPIATSLFVLFLTTAALFMTNNSQKSGILLFNDPSILAEYPAYREQYSGMLQTLLGNQYTYFGLISLNHYKDTFLPHFLVSHGGQHPWHSIVGRGHLYWTVYILFTVGLLNQLKKSFQVLVKKGPLLKKFSHHHTSLVPIFLLLVSPLPAIFTTDAPHATRSLFVFVMITVFATLGFEAIYQAARAKFKIGPILIVTVTMAFLCTETTVYLHQYFSVWPTQYPKEFQLGLIPIVQQITQEYPEDMITIVDDNAYTYAIIAWYQRIPVLTTLQNIKRVGPDTASLYQVKKLDRFQFLFPTEEVENKQHVIKRNPTDQQWQL